MAFCEGRCKEKTICGKKNTISVSKLEVKRYRCVFVRAQVLRVTFLHENLYCYIAGVFPATARPFIS